MFQWVPYPFVRIVAALIAGILMGIYFPEAVSIKHSIFALFFLVFVFAVLFLFRKKIKDISGWAGVLGLVIIFLVGYVHLFFKTERNNPNHLIHQQDTITYYKDTITYYTAVVISQSQEKENTWKLEATMQHLSAADWKPVEGDINLYLAKDDFEKPFQYGDVLLIKGSPQLVSPPGNPYEFDYQRYLSFQNIYHQHYLRAEDVSFVRSDPPNKILQYAFTAREWAGTTLKKYIEGKQEQAIVLGLVLGIKDGLDNELIGAYSASGGMHVLAVSGLHVGIIYLIVLFVLRPIGRSPTGKISLAIISALVLWAYALITGLSPSVLRAVTMFTFVAIAVPWKHRTNIYNTLAISAFCLLLFNPYLIMAVGFQLSYAAVLGIVYFQPIFYRAFTSRYFIVNKIWELTTVSIAAQLATFALGLLYFHQFPVYFLFSNLFIIPFAFIILIGGLMVLAFSFIDPIAGVLGICLNWIVNVLNSGVFFVESFPHSLIENVYLTTVQCWLIIFTIFSIISLLEFRKFKFLILTFLLITLLSFQQGNHWRRHSGVQQLTVYNISGHTAIDIFENETAYTFLDSALSRDQESIRFHIRPNRLVFGTTKIVTANALGLSRKFEGGMAIKHSAISLLWITEREHRLPINANFDFLVISKNAILSLDSTRIKARTIIIDSSNSSYLAKKLTSQAKKLGLSVHNTRTDGAFVFENR